MNNNWYKSAALKLSLYLRDRIMPELFERFSAFLDSGVTPEDIDSAESCLRAETAAENIVLEATKNNPIARTCVELALFEYNCPYAEELFGYVTAGSGVSLKISALISGADVSADIEAITDAYFIVSRILSRSEVCSDISKTRFCADFTFVSIMCGGYTPPSGLMNYLSVSSCGGEKKDILLWKDESARLAGQIGSVSSAVCLVYGEKFSGRRFFCEYTAGLLRLGLFAVDYGYLKAAQDDNALSIRLGNIIRDCFLLQCALCITDVDPEGSSDTAERIIKQASEELSFCSLPIFVTAEPNANISPFFGGICFSFSIPKLNAEQSRTVWRYFADRSAGKLRVSYENTADKILLPVGKIKRAVYEASVTRTNNERGLSEICYGLIEDTQYKGIKRVYPKYKWEDIKLAEKEERILRQICSHAKYKNTILDQWKTARLYPYGRCISALFVGPPGTGKTMAAHVIADALDLAIYRVDLSQVMDKYIGETEKHLERIFEIAERGNMILFLDEADALLGKRSEVTSAHDRFVNSEVSFLLQRIEEFDGIIIMATNFINNIDSAFIRRIRYTVKFPMPDRNIRNRIWRSLFNDALPHDKINYEFLSDEFELSGAAIKNIMLNAMIKAASEKIPLNMDHILLCMSEEYDKIGNGVLAQKILGYKR